MQCDWCMHYTVVELGPDKRYFGEKSCFQKFQALSPPGTPSRFGGLSHPTCATCGPLKDKLYSKYTALNVLHC